MYPKESFGWKHRILKMILIQQSRRSKQTNSYPFSAWFLLKGLTCLNKSAAESCMFVLVV